MHVAASKKPAPLATNGSKIVKSDSSSSDSSSDEDVMVLPKKAAQSAKQGPALIVVTRVALMMNLQRSLLLQRNLLQRLKSQITAALMRDEKPASEVKNSAVATAQKKNQELDGSDSDSDDSSDEDTTAKPVQSSKAVAVKKDKESSDSSDSDSDSDSEEDTTVKTVPIKKEESSGSSDSDSDSDSVEPAKSTIPVKRPLTTEKKSKHGDSDDSSDESDEEEPPQKKPKDSSSGAAKPVSNAAKKESSAKNSCQQWSSYYWVKDPFVGNLSYNVENDEVKQFFGEAGEVCDIRFATADDGSFKGFAHVEFATTEAAQKAYELNGHDLSGGLSGLILLVSGAITPGSGRDNSSFKKSGQSNTAFVRGFDSSLGEDEIRSSLQEHFSSCGAIGRVSIPKDYETGFKQRSAGTPSAGKKITFGDD
ncbi:hypothetical protein ZWY2020_054922 [Hordeum vulgare]|nr:hypothetical protein ZWY2020_054922 [Hordeum vulgare]